MNLFFFFYNLDYNPPTVTGLHIPRPVSTQFRLFWGANHLFDLPKELDLADIHHLVAWWKVGYDWRQHESWSNEDLSQFKRVIHAGTIRSIRVLHTRGLKASRRATPVLLPTFSTLPWPNFWTHDYVFGPSLPVNSANTDWVQVHFRGGGEGFSRGFQLTRFQPTTTLSDPLVSYQDRPRVDVLRRDLIEPRPTTTVWTIAWFIWTHHHRPITCITAHWDLLVDHQFDVTRRVALIV